MAKQALSVKYNTFIPSIKQLKNNKENINNE